MLLPKKHPSAFFGTPLASYLIERGVDTLVVTGCTTSGCVRGTVVDGFAYNFRVLVPHDAVYDRSQVSHAVNLFDMSEKYADVMSTDEALGRAQIGRSRRGVNMPSTPGEHLMHSVRSSRRTEVAAAACLRFRSQPRHPRLRRTCFASDLPCR